MVRTFISLAVALTILMCAAPAQIAPQKVAFAGRKISQPLPFKAGETLTYEVSFSKLIFSGSIGELRIAVGKRTDPAETGMLELTAEAVSKGFFPSLFGVKVRDRYTSLVNQNDFGLVASTKFLEEGKVRREQKSVVDREAGRLTFTDRDLADDKNAPRVKEKPSPLWIQDLLSTIYFVRTQPLKEGDVVAVPVSDAGEIYNIDVVAGKRDEVTMISRKIGAIQLNAKVFDGRYIKRSGEMLVWVTDDENRTPVRAKIKTSGYTITVDLKGISATNSASSL